MGMSVTPLTPAVGAEISGIDLAALNDAQFAGIETAWYRHSVLLLRGQTLNDDQLLAFSRRLGDLDPPPNQENGRQSPPGYPDVYVVSNILDGKGQPIAALGAGEASWHTDMSYLDLPPDASMLYALEIPPFGGNTWFCGMQTAWASMPAFLRASACARALSTAARLAGSMWLSTGGGGATCHRLSTTLPPKPIRKPANASATSHRARSIHRSVQRNPLAIARPLIINERPESAIDGRTAPATSAWRRRAMRPVAPGATAPGRAAVRLK